jgi:hypothetical protein
MFQEKNGDLYHLTVRKPDKAFVVGKMRDDYLMPESEYKVCRGITHATEAPAVVKRDGVYHLLASGSTGWAPNAARYFTSTSLEGPWTDQGNPCEGVNQGNGLGPDKTFGGQSTFIIPVEGHQDAYIAMFDIHNPEHPYESGYIWLPALFDNDRLSVRWKSRWNLEVFSNE